MPQWLGELARSHVNVGLFQSFFYWKCRNGKAVCRAILHACTTFQSFFYWKCRNGQDETGLKYRAKLRFNPSFTGNAAMAGEVVVRIVKPNIVSILLLLEMPQWPKANYSVCYQRSCFNPSFTGNAAMALRPKRLGAFSKIVSILLLLEMPQWHLLLECQAEKERAFQSFFYWKCRNGL